MSLLSFFGFLFSSYFCFSSFLFLLCCLHISFCSNLQTRSLFQIIFLFPFSNYLSLFCKHLNVRQLLFFFYSLPYFPFIPQQKNGFLVDQNKTRPHQKKQLFLIVSPILFIIELLCLHL